MGKSKASDQDKKKEWNIALDSRCRTLAEEIYASGDESKSIALMARGLGDYAQNHVQRKVTKDKVSKPLYPTYADRITWIEGLTPSAIVKVTRLSGDTLDALILKAVESNKVSITDGFNAAKGTTSYKDKLAFCIKAGLLGQVDVEEEEATTE